MIESIVQALQAARKSKMSGDIGIGLLVAVLFAVVPSRIGLQALQMQYIVSIGVAVTLLSRSLDLMPSSDSG